MEPTRTRSISSLSALLEFAAEVERLDVGGWGGPNKLLQGTAQPVLWGSLLFVATDFSFASVLPLATGRTRSGTAFGNIGKRDSAVAACGMMLGVTPISLISLLDLDSWLEILPPSESLARSISPQDLSMHSVLQRQENPWWLGNARISFVARPGKAERQA